MPESLFDPTALGTEGDLTLVLGRPTTTRFIGHRVKVHNDVAEAVRQIAADTVEALTTRAALDYADDLAFDTDEAYMLARRETLTQHRPARRRDRKAVEDEPAMVEMDPAVLDVLGEAASLPQLSRDELTSKRFSFYAAVFGDDPATRTAFVTQANPYKPAQLGQVLTSFGDGLRRITEPVLTFTQHFDLIVSGGQIAILRAQAFEKLFRNIDRLRARIPTWSTAAVEALPVSDESAAVIEQAALSSVRVASQLRGLHERGYLRKDYSPDALRQQLVACDLDAERLLPGGNLELTEEDVPVILKLIDEKLYPGWHSKTQWDVGTRAPR